MYDVISCNTTCHIHVDENRIIIIIYIYKAGLVHKVMFVDIIKVKNHLNPDLLISMGPLNVVPNIRLA